MINQLLDEPYWNEIPERVEAICNDWGKTILPGKDSKIDLGILYELLQKRKYSPIYSSHHRNHVIPKEEVIRYLKKNLTEIKTYILDNMHDLERFNVKEEILRENNLEKLFAFDRLIRSIKLSTLNDHEANLVLSAIWRSL